MNEAGFKTPSPKMAAAIVCVLLALFSFTYLVPVLNVPWLRADAQFDEALKQTLIVLLVGGVGYYIGSTKGSDEKNETIRQQAATAAVIAGAAPPAGGGGPLGGGGGGAPDAPSGTPEDPVSVTNVKPPAGFAPTSPMQMRYRPSQPPRA